MGCTPLAACVKFIYFVLVKVSRLDFVIVARFLPRVSCTIVHRSREGFGTLGRALLFSTVNQAGWLTIFEASMDGGRDIYIWLKDSLGR